MIVFLFPPPFCLYKKENQAKTTIEFVTSAWPLNQRNCKNVKQFVVFCECEGECTFSVNSVVSSLEWHRKSVLILGM